MRAASQRARQAPAPQPAAAAALREHSQGINALRFFVAILVMVVHVGYLPLRDLEAPAVVLNFLRNRSWTSEVFFVLSGFLLGSALIGRRFRYARYIIRRMARLYPMHAAAFALTIPTAFTGATVFTVSQAIAHSAAWLTMTHGFFAECATQYNPPAWAVTAFALGYLILPLAMRVERFGSRAILALMLALWGLTLAPGLAAIAVLGDSFAFGFDPETWTADRQTVDYLHAQPFTRVGEIVFGAWLAIVVERGRQGRMARWISFLGRDPVLVAGWAAFLAVFLFEYDDRWRYLLTHGLMVPAIAALIAATKSNRGRLSGLSAKPWIERGGKASLILYLIHYPVFLAVSFVAVCVGLDSSGADVRLGLAAIAAVGALTLSFAVSPHYDRLCDTLTDWMIAHLQSRSLRASSAP
jgi:peptidoglycan/LPS O-acetylase OafA/YrhL